MIYGASKTRIHSPWIYWIVLGGERWKPIGKSNLNRFNLRGETQKNVKLFPKNCRRIIAI